MDTPTILILVHDADGSLRYPPGEGFDGYLIELLIEEWKAMGYTVEVIHGIDQQVPADVVIPHVNLTVIPHDYRDFLRAYPTVINRHVVDISKSKFSKHLVGRDDPYAGPVIVKTDRNHGGRPEQRLFPPARSGQRPWAAAARRVLWQSRLRSAARRLLDTLDRRDTQWISWRSVETLDPLAYPVFPSIHDVPEGVFDNKNLVVEKFLPEIADGDTLMRRYFFLGSAEVNYLFRARAGEGVTAHATYRFEEVPVPTELYALRNELGFGYGKFDYSLRDGSVVLFDVNRTPNTLAVQNLGLAEEIARRLAPGIKAHLMREGKETVAPSLPATSTRRVNLEQRHVQQ